MPALGYSENITSRHSDKALGQNLDLHVNTTVPLPDEVGTGLVKSVWCSYSFSRHCLQ